MMALLRRFRPDHLTGQVTLVILAALFLFQLALATTNWLSNPEWRKPLVEPDEFIAAAILALDNGAPGQRANIAAALERAAPWMYFSLSESAPQEAARPAPRWNEEAADLRRRLWPGAQVAAVEAPGTGRAFVIALRNGGYVLAASHAERRSAHFGGERNAAGPFLSPYWERFAFLFFLIASVLTLWLSNAVISPLVHLAGAAERITDGESEPVPEAGPREVRDLSRALNRMQSRIRAMVAARSQALAAISHDLRTILTRVRLRTEFIEDDAMREKMLSDVETMDAMLHKNLHYLREGRESVDRSLIDLDSVLQTICDQYSDMGHVVDYEGGRHETVFGSVVEMQRLFGNLVENAVKHGTRATIAISRPDATRIQVDVVDDGPGIAPADREKVLEPFVRGAPARNMNADAGFGLGLSIVRMLAEKAGGAVQLLEASPHGLIARVTLPKA
ncbi:MAG: HAMP domain-containing protein [Hyphomicrobiales bacterium]|nr:HAMP domain-containing protein [Hyphomicrobiales bacterium]